MADDSVSKSLDNMDSCDFPEESLMGEEFSENMTTDKRNPSCSSSTQSPNGNLIDLPDYVSPPDSDDESNSSSDEDKEEITTLTNTIQFDPENNSVEPSETWIALGWYPTHDTHEDQTTAQVPESKKPEQGVKRKFAPPAEGYYHKRFCGTDEEIILELRGDESDDSEDEESTDRYLMSLEDETEALAQEEHIEDLIPETERAPTENIAEFQSQQSPRGFTGEFQSQQSPRGFTGEFHSQQSPRGVTGEFQSQQSPRGFTGEFQSQQSPRGFTGEFQSQQSPRGFTGEFQSQQSPRGVTGEFQSQQSPRGFTGEFQSQRKGPIIRLDVLDIYVECLRPVVYYFIAVPLVNYSSDVFVKL